MSTQPPANPELVAAITKFAVVEAVLFAAGVALFVGLDTIWGIVGAAVLSPLVLVFLLMQAGVFKGRDDRR